MGFLKRFFLSRATVLMLISLTTAAITAAALIPQSFMTPEDAMESWRLSHPIVRPIADFIGLHQIYTHPLFAVLLSGVVISLLFSTVEQCFRVFQRTFGPWEAAGGGKTIDLPGGPNEIATILRSNGYLALKSSGRTKLFARHPWGYWGNALLHLGMLVAIASSLLIAVTQQRGLLHIIEGEAAKPQAQWFAEENGVFAKRFELPFSVQLDRLEYSFWPTHGLKEVASTLMFMKAGQAKSSATVRINSILNKEGIRIYQGSELGHVFYVEIHDQSGDRKVFPLLMPHPISPDKAGYNDFREVLTGGELLRMKYYVNTERKSFEQFDPLLVLRVERSGNVLGQIPLRSGSVTSIGSYQFRLITVSRWTRLIFVNMTGMPGIFIGFFIIVLGGILHYFMPPREVILSENEGKGFQITWRATRFAGFYSDEYDRLCQSLLRGAARG